MEDTGQRLRSPAKSSYLSRRGASQPATKLNDNVKRRDIVQICLRVRSTQEFLYARLRVFSLKRRRGIDIRHAIFFQSKACTGEAASCSAYVKTDEQYRY